MIEFHVGDRFRNSFGEYVVRESGGSTMLVEYLDGERAGHTQVLTKAIQEAIAVNLLVKQAMPYWEPESTRRRASGKTHVAKHDVSPHELTPGLAYTMGFLAARGYLTAQVPEAFLEDFRLGYEAEAQTLMSRPSIGGLTVVVAEDRGYKWGISLGMRFKATDEELRDLDFQGVELMPDKGLEAHNIYSNALLWLFIQHGFLLGAQASERISERLPDLFRQHFAEGVAAATRVQ